MSNNNSESSCNIKWIVVFLLVALFIYMGYKYSEEDNNKNKSEDNISIEGYDGKISNVTLSQCGTECTISENCQGFGYKPVISTCYLSKKGILGEPVESAYRSEYSKLDRRCNKINPIDDVDFVSDTTLTQNSIYVCSDGENNENTEFQYANLGASSLETSDTIGASAGRGVPTKMGDRPATSTPIAVNYDLYKVQYPDPELGPLKDVTPNFPRLVRRSDKQLRKDQELTKFGTQAPPASNREQVLIADELTDESGRSAFIESDMEYLGQYLLGHQCVVNVPLYDCIKFCDNDPKCAGTEWNKSIIRSDGKTNMVYENVCCPKQVIKKIIPRRNQFSRGKFYVKTGLDKIKGRDSVMLTRQDFRRPNSVDDIRTTIQNNPRFDLQMSDRRSSDIYHHSEQDMSNVKPITNFILPGDLARANYS
jgi:PAN domain